MTSICKMKKKWLPYSHFYSLLAYSNKYYLEVYLQDNCAYKNYLDESLLED